MMFITPDTLTPDPYNPLDWNRYTYVRFNPVNATDPTGHATKLDDEGSDPSNNCPANTCYIEFLGDTPATTMYPISPATYGENIEGTSSGGGSPDALVKDLPDVVDPGFTVKGQTYPWKEPSNKAGAWVVAADVAPQIGNALVPILDPRRINIFVFYKVGSGGISIKSMDVQNNGSGVVIVKDVTFSGPSTGGRPGQYYGANPGPSISSGPAYSGFSPIVPGNSTATINLVPSGYSGNPSNTFYPGRGVSMIVRMALPVNNTSTLPYATIRGTLGQ